MCPLAPSPWDFLSPPAEFQDNDVALHLLRNAGYPGVVYASGGAGPAPPLNANHPDFYVDLLQESIEQQIDCRRRAWILDSCVLELKERLYLAVQKQFLKSSLQATGPGLIGITNRNATEGFKQLGLECLLSTSQRLQTEIARAISEKKPINFLAGLWTENEAAVTCILEGVKDERTLAYAFDRLHLSRLCHNWPPHETLETKAHVLTCVIGELHDVYTILESGLDAPDQQIRPAEKTVMRASLLWLAETLTMLIEFLVDCSKNVVGQDPDGLRTMPVETLARSIFYGTQDVESVLVRLIREGRVREVRLALEVLLKKNGHFSQSDRIRLLNILISSASPILAKTTPGERCRIDRSSLERAMTDISEAHTTLREVFEPVIQKLLAETELDATFDARPISDSILKPNAAINPAERAQRLAISDQAERQRCLNVSRILDTKKTVRQLYF